MLRKQLILILITLMLNGCNVTHFRSMPVNCLYPQVPVAGFTKAFAGDQSLQEAKITVLENGQVLHTNAEGQFGFCANPGDRITLELTKKSSGLLDNYVTTQSGTFFVPKQGMVNKNNEITFQVPRVITYAALKAIVLHNQPIKLQPNTCVVATTVTAINKTLADDPQGEAGAKIMLWHHKKLIKKFDVIYFGIIFDKTNPFDVNKDFTSADGGAVIYNLPASNTLYYLTAEKPGKKFTTESFLCRSGVFINLSPPHGPRVESIYHGFN